MPDNRMVIGYLRESNAEGADPESQKRDIRALAARDQHDPATIVWRDDWGRSGSGRQNRPAFRKMREDIDAGNVSVIYARSVDRLTREGLTEGMAFVAFARLRDVRVVTEREGELTIDPDSQSVWQTAAPFLTAAEESRLGRLRARSARSTRMRSIEAHRASCSLVLCPDTLHWDGRRPYGATPGEDLPAVIAAFREARSFAGAATLLNDRNVRSQRGGRWEETTVRRIIRWAAEHGLLTDVTLPRVRSRGRRLYAVHALSGLVRCPHDSTLLTSTWRTTRSGREVGLFCRVGRSSSSHPRPYSVPQAVIFEYVRRVTDTLTGRVASPDQSADVAAMEALRIQRRNAVLALSFSDSADTSELEQRITDLTEQLARLEAATSVVVDWTTGVDWTLAPGDLNARLRSIISAVRLDARFRPVGIDWTVEPVIIEPGVPTLVDDGVPMVIAGAKPGAWRTGSVGAEGLTGFGESATVRPADPASGSTEESAS